MEILPKGVIAAKTLTQILPTLYLVDGDDEALTTGWLDSSDSSLSAAYLLKYVSA